MKYAGFWPRALALLVDFLIWLPLIGLSYMVRMSRTGTIASDLAGYAFSIAYPVFMHGHFGQTLGKMAARIQVRMVDGAVITWRGAWLRSAVDIVFGVIFAVGTVYVLSLMPSSGFDADSSDWAQMLQEREPAWLRYATYAGMTWTVSELVVLLFNKKRRALHDFIAGTVVVRLEPGINRPAADTRPGSEAT